MTKENDLQGKVPESWVCIDIGGKKVAVVLPVSPAPTHGVARLKACFICANTGCSYVGAPK